ncbi:MAG: iron ABC transporter permease [Hyphomicrobiales bacterium]|nr:iron ABC transporter permease [Hyphomicrobiales bacterium]
MTSGVEFGPAASSVAGVAQRAQRRRWAVIAVLAAGLAAASLISLGVGAVPVSPGEALRAAFGLGDVDPRAEAVVNAIRLPRLILGLAAGATLGLCGSAMQAFFRNPLADPGLLGVSNGAAVAAAAYIIFGSAAAGALPSVLAAFGLPAAAFCGGLAAIYALFAFGRRGGVISSAQMLLAGVAIGALAGSGLAYLTFISTDQQLRAITFWMLGSLGGATWEQLGPSCILGVAACMGLLRLAGPLNAYLLGEREAQHLGVDVEALKRSVILMVAVGVGAIVAVTGVIGFIGLVAPHMVRLFAGADHRVVLPGSALMGALLVVLADAAARTVVAPAELPIGVLTSLFGAPFFLWLLTRRSGAR